MAFRFHKASCVVAGTFNIYILHPHWLTRHGLIEEGTEVLIETNLAQPGFRFRLAKQKTVWNVAPIRVAVETEDPQVDCGAMIAKVLAKLPETPLFALGNNAVYRADPSEAAALSPAIRDFPWKESPNSDEKLTHRTFHAAVKRNQHEVANLQVSLQEEHLELLCNMHTELRDREGANLAAVAAAERFLEDRAVAASLAKHFFGVLIDNGSHND